MKIKIDELSDKDLELSFSGKENVLSLALQKLPQKEARSLDPRIMGNVKLIKSGKEIFLTGSVRGILHLQCSRCLADFDLDKEIELSLVLRTESGSVAEEHEILEAEGDELIIQGSEIDLGEIIVNEIMLSIPMKPLCSPECPGLCPTCGEIQGSEKCKCSEEQRVDPRWEALAKLKDKTAD